MKFANFLKRLFTENILLKLLAAVLAFVTVILIHVL